MPPKHCASFLPGLDVVTVSWERQKSSTVMLIDKERVVGCNYPKVGNDLNALSMNIG
jgi:hypothetical protein